MNRKGYGGFLIWGRRRLAHRISYELTYGPIPDGMRVLHHCDNPCCVRPDHLFLGTEIDNHRDASAKGRHVQGERVGSAKLDPEKVREIRRKHAEGVRICSLVREYGVTDAGIISVVKRKTWRHIK